MLHLVLTTAVGLRVSPVAYLYRVYFYAHIFKERNTLKTSMSKNGVMVLKPLQMKIVYNLNETLWFSSLPPVAKGQNMLSMVIFAVGRAFL